MTSPQIDTPRLRLNTLAPADAPALFAYRSDPSVARYQGWLPGSVDDVTEFIRAQQSVAFDTPGTWFQFALRLRDTDELVGDLGVHFSPDDVRQVELGFTVAPAHQRQGLALEAVSAVLDQLLGVQAKHRVYASVDPRNAASIALLRRVGMRQEAHFRESIWSRGEWVDDVVFAILRSEWSER